MTHEEAILTQEELRPMLASLLLADEYKTEVGEYSLKLKEDTPEYYLRIIFPAKFIGGNLLRRLSSYCAENNRHISIVGSFDLYISLS